jgi:hypothetical protein
MREFAVFQTTSGPYRSGTSAAASNAAQLVATATATASHRLDMCTHHSLLLLQEKHHPCLQSL